MTDVFTGGDFQTNGWLFGFPGGGTILFDAPDGIAEWLVSRGRKVDALLLTHLHYDHIIDVAAVKRDHDCPIYAHSRPDPDLTLETVLREVMGMPFDVGPFEIDVLLAGQSEVKIESIDPPIGILHVPGHSPDSLCFGPIQTDEGPMLAGGDVLFQGSIGRTDFPHGDHDLLISGIREKVFALPDDTRVLPGHGPVTTVGFEKAANPFVGDL